MRIWLSAALLLVAGCAEVFAAWNRWLPCTAAFDDKACARAENHLRDYAIISAPFEAIASSVIPAAIGSGLTGLFWLIQAMAAANRRGGARRVRVFAAVAGGVSLLVGWQQLVATVTESRWGVMPWQDALVFGLAITLAPLIAGTVLAFAAPGADRTPWVVLGVGTIVSAPTIEFLLLIPQSDSYDSPIGVGYAHGITLLLAGSAFAVLALRRRQFSRRSQTVA